MKEYIKPTAEIICFQSEKILALSAIDKEGNKQQLSRRKDSSSWSSEAWTTDDDEDFIEE